MGSHPHRTLGGEHLRLRVSFVDSATLETAGAIEFPNVTLADWGA
jgi:hypothetical protein